MSELKLLPCPFCGGEDIGYSVKTTGRWERKYHVAMYCKDCNCYGKRVLVTPTENTRYDVERNEEYKKLAIKDWNTRKPMANIVEKLEELKMRYFLTIANTGDDKNDFAYENVGNALDHAINIVKQEINNGLE
jgi:Lar family restriction alleviation protein